MEAEIFLDPAVVGLDGLHREAQALGVDSLTCDALAVIDQRGLLQGVVSMNDIVRTSERTGEPEAKAIVSALAAICAGRPAAPVTGWLPHAGIDAPRHGAGR